MCTNCAVLIKHNLLTPYFFDISTFAIFFFDLNDLGILTFSNSELAFEVMNHADS
jgi:hypothetical protein